MISIADKYPSRGSPSGYFSISTQFDNVGDALINRELILLISQAMTTSIDISRCPPSFIKTLNISEHNRTTLVKSRIDIFTSMVRDRIRGIRPYYFLNPGGYFGEISIGAAASGVFKLAMLMLLNVIGVRVCQVGVSYERIGMRHGWILRLRSALLHRHMVRDKASARYAASLGVRVDGTIPDLAFGAAASKTPDPEERRALGISFRLDALSETTELVARLIRLLDQELPPAIGFKFVSQVTRDEAGMRNLARLAKRRTSVFCEVSDSIEDCQDAYSDCSYVIGNRLHALLIGVLSGAAPLAVIDSASNAKISGLFEDLDATGYLFDLNDNSAQAISACIKSGKRPTIDVARERERLVQVFFGMIEAP